MKIRRYLMICIVALFAACIDINEQIVINKNGSGHYSTKMDLSQMIEMMQAMAGDEQIAKEGLDKSIDTTVFMKDLLDSAKDVTAEQREILKNGKINLKMIMKEKVFSIESNFPYKNLSQLQALMADAGGSSSMGKVFKNVFGKEQQKADTLDTAIEPLDAPKEPSLEDLNTVFDVTVKNGLISKKLNPEKHKAMNEKPELAQMKSMGASGLEILSTTVIKLPRPAKKTEGQFIKLSDGKKTVTIRYNLLEVFDAPEKFSYTIEY